IFHDLSRDALHIRERLWKRDLRFDASIHLKSMSAPEVRRKLRIRQYQRRPHLDQLRKLKIGRHDANNLVKASADIDGVADHTLIRGKTPLPNRITDDDDTVLPLLVFTVGEGSANLGADSKHTEEICAHHCAQNTFRAVADANIEVGLLNGRNVR